MPPRQQNRTPAAAGAAGGGDGAVDMMVNCGGQQNGKPIAVKHSVHGCDNPGFKLGLHDYEELPSTAGFPFVSNDYLHTTDDSVTSSVKPTRSFRRRDNPLYDTVRCKEPAAVTSDHVTSPPSCVMFVLLVVCLLFTALALILAIVSIAIATQTRNAADQQLLTQLETDVQQLRAQVDSLVSETSLQRNLIGQLNQSDVTITQSMKSLETSQQLQQFNWMSQFNSLQTTLNNITKFSSVRPVNLSVCAHYSNITGGPSAYAETQSGALDLSAPGPLQGWVITGALCTTTGGTQAFLKYDPNSPQRYLCVCRGAVDNSTVSRYCELHYWVCPRTL
jgi:hypothetical protein